VTDDVKEIEWATLTEREHHNKVTEMSQTLICELFEHMAASHGNSQSAVTNFLRQFYPDVLKSTPLLTAQVEHRKIERKDVTASNE
jgi:hypothetical protein